jgi:hypothetical protein
MLDPSQRKCHSVAIKITQKLNTYAFRRTASRAIRARNLATSNNSLIDCHAEVWTRFPIHTPIAREPNDKAIKHPASIHFVSNLFNPPFARYFREMAMEFEARTRKPTGNKLRNTQVGSVRRWPPSTEKPPISKFSTGDWLVGLFCLIPIHIAITASNGFVPLKDGVTSADFEDQLLGADVLEIARASVEFLPLKRATHNHLSISFGWYESIFSSYLANKVAFSQSECSDH